MQPCFDFRNGFSCDICVDFRPIPRPQENRSFRVKLFVAVLNFDWHSGAAERQIARPLHIRSAREWKNE